MRQSNEKKKISLKSPNCYLQIGENVVKYKLSKKARISRCLCINKEEKTNGKTKAYDGR